MSIYPTVTKDYMNTLAKLSQREKNQRAFFN